MLATLIPMFDKNMIVMGYSVFAQRDNLLLDPIKSGSGYLDSAMRIEGMDIINNMGLDTLVDNRQVFLYVGNVSLFTDIKGQGATPTNRIVILIDHSVKPEEQYVERIKALRAQGYKFAIKGIPLNELGNYKAIIDLMDYMFLNHLRVNIVQAKKLFNTIYPNVKLCAVNVGTQEEYDALKETGGFELYEGEFFRLPRHSQDTELAPLKVTYLELLKIVNNPDFDLTKAADTIGRDPALVLSLLKIVNNMTVNSGITSVRNAAAMMGQKELKRWINTAVTKELCSDRPSEVTRMSLIRARFAENLAPVFNKAGLSQELFLMGLFSVLDIILEKPMEECLESINVSKAIRDALVGQKGEMAEILNFMKEYENASWQEVSRLGLLGNINLDAVYEAYLSALSWYKDLISL
ncbi:MAG: HDOD domain-containing protein [Lachnospiraceae bacterium]|nr:HDOD domain-containing protein [Lachnospiraceae bacterium]